MYKDIFSTKDLITINSKLINKVGLTAAVYFSELLVQGENLDSFKINSRSILERTTLTKYVQLKANQCLTEAGLIETSPESGEVSINYKAYISILTEETEEEIEKLNTKEVKKKERVRKTPEEIEEERVKKEEVKKLKEENKKFAIIENLMQSITTQAYELRIAYRSWIESLYDAKKGVITKQAVLIAQDTIDSATLLKDKSGHDLDKALEILKIATINSWIDVSWAVNRYNSNIAFNINNHKNNSNISVKDDRIIDNSPMILIDKGF